MLSKENQLKVAGLSAVLATTLGLGGALVAPATALADADPVHHGRDYVKPIDPVNTNLKLNENGNAGDWKDQEHKEAEVKLQDVVRLYNPWTGEHLFSADQAEVAAREKDGWKNEGTFWKAYTHLGDWQSKFKSDKWDTAVYRLYNPNNGEHLYTTAAAEYNKLTSIGWNGEGVVFYSVKMALDANNNVTSDAAFKGDGTHAGDEDAINKAPQGVYRAFNKNVEVGTHNFAGYEENATMLANGWLPDNVVDGKQQPLFMVYDLDHTVNEAKVAQSFARISKEYKANLEKYKALKKELLDALLAAKYDKDTEVKNLDKVADVTKSLQRQLDDTKVYLTKLKYQADEILADIDGKYGKDGSEAKSKAYEVLFEKDNYTKLEAGDYANAVTALNNAKVELATRNGALMTAQAELAVKQAKLDLKTAAYNEAKKAYDTCPEDQKAAFLAKVTSAENGVKTAQGEFNEKKSGVETAQKNVDDQKKVVEQDTQKVADLAAQLETHKKLFKENVQKFQDFRHTQTLKQSQALRDLEVYAKYAMVYADLKQDLDTLAEKEAGLNKLLAPKATDKDTQGQPLKDIATQFIDLYEKALTESKKNNKLPDLSSLKSSLEAILDQYFLHVVPTDDGFNF